uniref:Ribonuclease H-like domain-containing protein n=1 Tax=Tanacetum cinerariifolium TaxID=118510 RepID=A0A6L2JVD1_TANCI|nr:ribonuclease H-like domain-containing protein [Tanacetum cinerariifolium]
MVKQLDGGVKFLMYPRFVQVFLDNQVEMDRHNAIFVISSYTKNVFSNMMREGKDFSGKVTPLFQSIMVQAPKDMGEGSEIPTDHPPIVTQPSCSSPQEKQKSRRKLRKEIEVPSPSSKIPNKERLPLTSNDPLHSEITLVDDTQGRMNEEDVFRVNDLDGDEVVVDVSASEKVEQSVKVVEKEVSTVDPVTTVDCELAARLQKEERGELSIEEKPRYVVPTCRVIVPTGRYIVPTVRVIVATSRTGKDHDGSVIILPPTTAEEHIVVQRESKARTTLLQSIPDDHVADFHYLDDARDIWNAVKDRFGEGFHKGYDKMQKILSQLNQLKAKPDAEDINLKFLRALPSSCSQVALTLKTKGGLECLSIHDLHYKLKILEVDVKGYSTFSSSQSVGPSHSSFVSATSSSKKMSYGDSPNYSLTTTYSVPSNSETGSHRSGNVIEDVLQSFVADTEPEQQLAYEDLEQIEKLDLEEMDMKWQMAMLSIRVHKFKQKAGRKINFDKKESASESDGVIAAKEFGMIAGCDSEVVIKEGDTKLYNMITGANLEEANTTGAAGEFALMGVTSEAYKNSLKTLEKQKRVLQRNQLTLEDKIRVMSIELENTSNLLKNYERINTDVETAKKDLQTKLDNHLARTKKWRNSSKNLFKLIDSSMFAKTDIMKAVPPPLTRDNTSLSDHTDLDESQISYGTNSSTSYDPKYVPNDFVSCDDSDKSSEVNTNNLAASNSSLKSLEHKPTDSTSCASTSSVSTSKNEAEIESNVGTPIQEPIIVQDLPSFTCNSSDKNEHTSRTSCNKNGYFNKKAGHFRKNASSVSMLCFVCGSGTHLIKDCDFYEKQMANKTIGIGVGLVYNRNKVNYQNQFIPQATLLRTSKVDIPPVRPQRVHTSKQKVTPVPNGKPKVTPVPTSKPKVTPVPTGKPQVSTLVPNGRPNRPFLVLTDRGFSPSVISGWWSRTARPMPHSINPTSSYFQTYTPYVPTMYYKHMKYGGDTRATPIKLSAGTHGLSSQLFSGFGCWLTTTQQMVFNSPCLTDKKELIHHEGKDISNPFMVVMICQKSLGYSNSPMIHVLRGGLVINLPGYVVPTGRVIVPTGRYIVSTSRVIVATGRYVVLAVKARFGGNAESKNIRKHMLKQEFSEFRIREEEGLHKLYDKMQKILSQLNQLKAKPDAEDINLKFLRALPSSWSQPEQQLAYEDLEHIEKLDLEEMDLKWQMAMLSVRVHKFEQKAGRKIDFDKKESARFNKKKEIGKKEEDSKAFIIVDTLVDWTNHNSESDGVIAAKEFGMIASCDSKVATKEGATKLYNLIIGANSEEANTTGAAGEFALMGVTSKAYKNSLKTLEKQKRVLQRNQLTLEDKIRVLSIELENTSNLLKHHERINADVETAKKDLETKLDNHLARTKKWRNSSKNLFKLIDSSMSVRTKVGRPIFNRFAKTDSMKVVPLPLTGDYTSLSDHTNLDESQMSYGTNSLTSCDPKYMPNDFVSYDNSDKSLEVNTNDLASSDSSLKSLEHKPTDSTSCASTSNVSTSKNEVDIESNVGTPIQEPIIVQDLPSFTCNSSDKNEHTSMTSCNKNGYFNKKAGHFRKNASFVSKLCFVCGSGTHLIKDCDFYEKQMANKTVSIGVGPVYNRNKVNYQNQFVLQVVLLWTGKVHIPPVRPQPVPTNKPKGYTSSYLVIVPTGRYIVPTDRVIVATGRYVVPAVTIYLEWDPTRPTAFSKSSEQMIWNDVRLQVDYEVDMAYVLLRLIMRQINEGYVPE